MDYSFCEDVLGINIDLLDQRNIFDHFVHDLPFESKISIDPQVRYNPFVISVRSRELQYFVEAFFKHLSPTTIMNDLLEVSV